MIAASCDRWLFAKANTLNVGSDVGSDQEKIDATAPSVGGPANQQEGTFEEDDWDDDEWEDVDATLTLSTNTQPPGRETFSGDRSTDGTSYWDTSAFAKNLESVFLATFESGLAFDFKTPMHLVVALDSVPGAREDLVKPAAEVPHNASCCSGIECHFASVRAQLAQLGLRPRFVSVNFSE